MPANDPLPSRPLRSKDSPAELLASLERAGDIPRLVQVLEALAQEGTTPPSEAARLLLRGADLAHQRLHDSTRALALLRQALRLAPQEREPLRALRLLCEQRQDPAALAAVLERLAAQSRPEEASAFYLQAADIYEHKLGRRDQAILCCQRASRLWPREREALRRSRQLLIAENLLLAALESLDRERATFGPAGLADEYLALGERWVEDPFAHLLARRSMNTALTLMPGHPRAAKLERALHTFQETWRDRVRTLRARTVDEQDRESAARLFLQIARLLAAYEPNGTGKMKEALERCFFLWPAMPEALDFLAHFGGDSAHWDAPAWMEKMAQSERARPAQAELWMRAGMFRLGQQADRAWALQDFERAAAAAPGRADICSLTLELLLDQERPQDAAQMLERHVVALDDPGARVETHLRLADLYMGPLAEGGRAREHLQAVLRLEPAQPWAARRLAHLLLEVGEPGAAEPLLGPALQGGSVKEGVALCRTLAQAWLAQGEAERAGRALYRALLLDPAQRELLAESMRLARLGGTEEALVATLSRSVEVAPEPAASLLWKPLAQLLTEPLRRPKDAERAWSEVLQRFPDDAEARQALAELQESARVRALSGEGAQVEGVLGEVPTGVASAEEPTAPGVEALSQAPQDVQTLERLASAYAALGRWDEVAKTTQRLMEMAPNRSERQRAQLRLGQLLAERLGRKEDAVGVLLEVLESLTGVATEPPSSAESRALVETVRTLERLASEGVRREGIERALAPVYARTGAQQRELAKLLTQLGAATDPAHRRELLHHLAAHQEHALLDTRAALTLWLQAVALNPADDTARTEARRLAKSVGAEPDLVRAWLALATGTPSLSLARVLVDEATTLAEGRGLLTLAEHVLVTALTQWTDEPSFLARLYPLQQKGGHLEDAEHSLRRLLLLDEDGATRPNLYLALCELNVQLGRPRSAARALEEAMNAGARPTLHVERWCRLLEEAQEHKAWGLALDFAEKVAREAKDPALQQRLALQRARSQTPAAALSEGGIEAWVHTLEHHPADTAALEGLERLLALPESRTAAARALAGAYARLQEHRKHLAMLELLVTDLGEPAEKLELLQRMAGLQEKALRQPHQAFAALARALALAPANRGLHSEALRVADACDAVDSYVEVVEELLELAPSNARVALHRSLAELYERRLGDRPSAVRHLRSAVELVPQDLELLQYLHRLHLAGEEWAALAEVLERIARVSPEPARQVAAWREAAAVHEQRLWDAESAADCWREVAALSPRSDDAVAALERLYTELDAPEGLAFALELGRARHAGDLRGLELTVRLAQVKAQRLGAFTEALELCREVLQAEPSHPGAREVLEGWVRRPGEEGPWALAVLDPLLAASQDTARRISLRESLLPTATPELQARWSAEVRSLWEKELRDPVRAFHAGLAAFRQGIDRLGSLPELLRLAPDGPSREQLAEALEAAAEWQAPGTPELASLLRHAAVLRGALGQDAAATRLWNDLLAEVPEDLGALEQLARLYERARDAKNLSEVYARKAKLAHGSRDRQVLLLRAGVAHEQAGEDALAIEAFREALSLGPSHEALFGLERLYGRGQRWTEQAEVLRELSSMTLDGEERQRLLSRRGRLLEQLGEATEAARVYAEALALPGASPEVLSGLERLVQLKSSLQEATLALEAHYRQRREPRRLVEVLEKRLQGSAESERAGLLDEIARLHESLGQGRLAFVARLRGFAQSPEDGRVRFELERLAQESGAVEELLAAYQDQLERGTSEALAAALWRRIAVLREKRLGRPDLALEAWGEAVRYAPHERSLLRFYADACRQAHAFRQLASVLQQQVESEASVEVQLDLLFELAQLGESALGDRNLAVDAYERILVRAPAERSALRALSRIHADARQYEALATVLARDIQATQAAGSSEDSVDLQLKLGQLELHRLNKAEAALERFRSVLARDPSHAGALAALEEMAFAEGPLRHAAAKTLRPLLESAGRHARLVHLLEANVLIETEAAERAALLRQIAELRAGPLADPEMAFLSAARALRALPGDEAALAQCLALAPRADADEELCALLEEVGPTFRQPVARAQLYRALAPLQEAQGEKDAATASWREVLALLPEDLQATEAVDRLLQGTERPEALALFLTQRLAVVEEPATRVSLLLRLASAQEKSGEPAASAASLAQAFAFSPTLEVLAQVEQAFERLGRHAEQAESLARMAAMQAAQEGPSSGERQRNSLLRRARALVKAGEPQQAFAGLEAILAQWPAHPEALEGLASLLDLPSVRSQAASALEPLLSGAHSAALRVRVLEALLETAAPEKVNAWLQERATLLESLGQGAQALESRRKVFEAQPGDEATRDAYERLAVSTGAVETLLEVYERVLSSTTDAALALALQRRRAEWAETRLQRPSLALSLWEDVSRRVPRDPSPLRALARIYRQAGNDEHLVAVLLRQVEAEPETEAQVDLLYEAAQLTEETLGKLDEAAHCYRQILQRAPEDRAALGSLANVLERKGRHRELAEVLRRQMALADASREPAQAEVGLELRVRLGRLLHGPLGDSASAVTVLAEVLQRRPSHPAAALALEEVMRSSQPSRGAAAELLAPLFSTAEQHRKLADALEAQVATAPQAAQRVELLLRLSALQAGPLASSRGAFQAAAQALRELPDEPRALAACLRFSENVGLIEPLVDLLAEVVARMGPGENRIESARALARALEQQGRLSDATQVWQRLISELPADAEALARATALLERQARWLELQRVLEQQLLLPLDRETRVALLGRMGELQDVALADAEGALATLRQLLELQPSDLKTLQRMDRLYERRGQWTALAEVLIRRMELEPPLANELKSRLAVLRETHLNDDAGAVALYAEILAEAPSNAGAMTALARRVEKDASDASVVLPLLAAYRRQSNVARLAPLLEARARVAPEAPERKALWAELGALRERELARPDLAFQAWVQAVGEDPEDEAPRAEASRLGDALGVFSALAEVLNRALPRVSSDVARASLCLQLGALYEEKLSAPELAVERYNEARAGSDEQLPKALQGLDRVLTRLERWPELLPVLERLETLSPSPTERVELLSRMGALAEGPLENPARALRAYQSLIALDPTELPALHRLEALYSQLGLSTELMEVLERIQPQVQGAERERVLLRMAAVALQDLRLPERAAQICRELLEADPRNDAAFALLAQLLESERRYGELKEVLHARLAVSTDLPVRVALHRRMASLLHGSLRQPAAAVPYYEALLEESPRDLASLRALRDIYRGLDEKEALAEVLERIEPVQGDADAALEYAEALESLGRKAESQEAARRALELKPQQAVELSRLRELFLRLEAWSDAVRSLELSAEWEATQGRLATAAAQLLQAADVLERIQDVSGLARVLERLLVWEPGHRVAQDRALALYRRLEKVEAYARRSEAFLPHLSEGERQAALDELVALYEERLQRKDEAFRLACDAFQAEPLSTSKRERVERLAHEAKAYALFVQRYRAVAEGLPRGPLSEQMSFVLAQVEDQHLDDVEAAERTLNLLLDVDPAHARALDALIALFERRGLYRKQLGVLQRKLEVASESALRKSLLLDMAEVAEQRLSDPDAAVLHLQRALELSPEVEIAERLVALHRRRAQWPEAVSALIATRKLAQEAPERARIQVALAEIQERELKDLEAAVGAYHQALAFYPPQREAFLALERLLQALDRPEELLRVYEQRLQVADAPEERIALFFKRAELFEGRRRDRSRADACFESVLELAPDNLLAIEGLKRIRRSEGKWKALSAALERHVAASKSPQEQSLLGLELGHLYRDKLSEPEKAEGAWLQALEANPDNLEALRALASLWEWMGRWPAALKLFERAVALLTPTADAAELLHHMGEIRVSQLRDLLGARASYLKALELVPGHFPSLRALRVLYEADRDWPGYELTLVQEAEHSSAYPDVRMKASLELARHLAERREDLAGATRWYEEALKSVPTSLEAAKALADLALSREELPRARQMLEIVVAQLDPRLAATPPPAPSSELCRELSRLGQVARQLGDSQRALSAYARALEEDASFLPALRGQAAVLAEQGQKEQALTLYQALLSQHRRSLGPTEIVETHGRVGDLLRALGQPERARDQYEQALSIDRTHAPSLRALIALSDTARQAERSATFRERLSSVVSGEEQFQLLRELGTLARDRLGDPRRAVEAWLGALRVNPSDLGVMQSLSTAFREARLPRKAAEMLDALLVHPALKADKAQRTQLSFALAELTAKELQDVDRAAQAYLLALELEPRFAEAQQGLESLLHAAKRWQQLDDSYQRLARFQEQAGLSPAVRAALWRTLGELRLVRMGDKPSALQAFEKASALLPEDAATQERFADLALQLPEREAESLPAYLRALPATEDLSKICRAALQLAQNRQDADSAHLAGRALVCLAGATPRQDERAVLDRLSQRARSQQAPLRPLSEALWKKHLMHPDVRGPLGELLALLFEHAGSHYAAALAGYRLNAKKHRVELAYANEPAIQQLQQVASLLRTVSFELYSPYRAALLAAPAGRAAEAPTDADVGLEVCHTYPFSLVAGGAFFQKREPAVLQALLASRLALLRPELALAQRLPLEKLELLLEAALSLCEVAVPAVADPKALRKEQKLLEKALDPPVRAGLAVVARQYAQVAQPTDLRRFVQGVAATAVRAALFAAGDPGPVLQALQGERALQNPLKPLQRELISFSVSGDLHALRVAAGRQLDAA